MLDPVPASPRASVEPTGEPAALRRPRISDASFFAALFRATVLQRQASLAVPFGSQPSLHLGKGESPGGGSLIPYPFSSTLLAPFSRGSLQARGKGLEGDAILKTPVPRLGEGVGGEGIPAQAKTSSAPLGPAVPSISLPSLPTLPSVDPSGIVSGILGLLPGQSSSAPMQLSDYPKPAGDTGRGFHWIPTLHQDPAAVDTFVQDAKNLGASWVTFLNDGSNVGQNDYLVQKLVENNIEPVMRIYTPNGQPISGDLTGMVQHYAALGVHYFLPYNEPNLPEENPNGQVSASGYVDRWIPAAKAILAGGGLPGIGGLAPGAPVDDVQFLHATLDEIKRRGATDLLNKAWISVHNYTFNRPASYQDDSNGFLKFRWYDQVARQVLGRDVPIISTEGGPRMGDDVDHRYPPVDEARRDQIASDTFAYLDHREPYFFAQTQWVLANQAGGGHDSAWNADALYGANGSPTPLAQTLQNQEATA